MSFITDQFEYKIIHQIMYKIKNKKRKEKNESSTFIYMNWAELRLNSSFIDLRLQKFMHIIKMIEIKLLRLN